MNEDLMFGVEHLRPGQILRHFKRDLKCEYEKQQNQGLYQVLGTATHTETAERLLIYQEMCWPFQVYARPLSMVFDEVDTKKYPNAEQKHRFEIIESVEHLLRQSL